MNIVKKLKLVISGFFDKHVRIRRRLDNFVKRHTLLSREFVDTVQGVKLIDNDGEKFINSTAKKYYNYFNS